MPLLIGVDLAVSAAPDPGGDEQPTTTTHASEGTLVSAEVVVGVSSK